MSWAAVAVAGAAVVGAVASSSAADKGAKATQRAAQAGISEQQAAREDFNRRTQPFTDIGLAASPALAQLLGIQVPSQDVSRLEGQLADIDRRIEAGPPVASSVGASGLGKFAQVAGRGTQPVAGDFDPEALQAERADVSSQLDAARLDASPQAGPLTQLDEINPLVSFLRDEGFEGIQESAAARGRLGAGGTLKDLTRFNTQLASTVVPQLQQQRFNQLFSVLGLGANAATGQGTAALNTASNIGNLQGNIGQAQALNAQQQGQIGANLASNLAGTFGAQQGGLFAQTPPPQQTFGQQNVGTVANPNAFEAFS